MRLTPPKKVTFYLSVSLALISLMIETMAVTGIRLFSTGGLFHGRIPHAALGLSGALCG